MKTNNYNEVLSAVGGAPADPGPPAGVIVHKRRAGGVRPKFSVILLDWDCRESLHTLDWLERQDVPRDSYELIWIDLYSRLDPKVMAQADVVITCNQVGMYHKHKGYNVGLLEAAGDLICVCDSDAVFPRDWVRSVFDSFWPDGFSAEPRPIVLMHHELRTSFKYPADLTDAETLKDQARWNWWPIVPNAGACMTVRRVDAIRFGGFDEHETYRGYLCGPYDLGWRLCNAGWPEIWHPDCVLWHFAHPDPVAANGFAPALSRLRENTYPHVDMHAWTAVDAFSSGRFQPLLENPRLWRLRMEARQIGTEFEAKYARMTGPEGLPAALAHRLKRAQRIDIYATVLAGFVRPALAALGRRVLGAERYARWRGRAAFLSPQNGAPRLIESVAGYALVSAGGRVLGVPHALGAIDPGDPDDLANPAVVVAPSLRAARRMVRRRPVGLFLPRPVEAYRNYSVVCQPGVFYAIPAGIETPHPWRAAARARGVLRAASVEELMAAVDAVLDAPRPG